MAPKISNARPRTRKPRKPNRTNKTPKAKINFHNYNINSEYKMHPETARILREYFQKYPISYYAGKKIGPFSYFLESLKSTGLDRDINKILASNSPRKAEEIEHRLRIDIYLEHVFGFKYLSENIKQNAFELIFRIMLKEHLIALNGNPIPKPPRTSVGITDRNKEADRDIVKTLEDYPQHIGNRREVIDPGQEAILFSYPNREYQGPVTKGRELVKFSNPETQKHQNPEIDTSAPIIKAEKEIIDGVEEILGKTKKQSKKTRTQLVTEFLKDRLKKIIAELVKKGNKLKDKAQEIDLEALKKVLITKLQTLSRRNPKLIDEKEVIAETIRSINNLSQTKHRMNTNEITEPKKDPWTRPNYPGIKNPGELQNLPARIQRGNTSLERFVKEPQRKSLVEKLYLTPEEQSKIRLKNYEKKFEDLTNKDITKTKEISELLELINLEKILELVREINFATRYSKTTFNEEQLDQLKQLSAKYEKFSKALLLIKGNEKKFTNHEVQELLFWLKKKDILESDNLERFITGVIQGKKYTPENISLEDWQLLNRFADSRNLYGQDRINYLEKILKLPQEKILETLEEIKKLLKPKKRTVTIEEKPLEPIGDNKTFKELTEALKNGNYDKVIEYVRKNTTINKELMPTLKSASKLNLKLRQMEQSKNIEELIKNFDILTFEEEHNNLMKFIKDKRNLNDSFYPELQDFATKSRLILESMRIIIKNKSRFIGQDFRILLEILKDPNKITDLERFIKDVLEKEPLITDIDPSEIEVLETKNTNILEINTETKKNLSDFLKNALGFRYRKNIPEFTAKVRRYEFREGSIITIDGLKAIIRKIGNELELDFGNNNIIRVFDNVRYVLTSKKLIIPKKSLFSRIKDFDNPKIFSGDKILGTLYFKDGKLIAYLP